MIFLLELAHLRALTQISLFYRPPKMPYCLQDGLDAMSVPTASQNAMAISGAVNQFYPSKDIRSEYRATMCQKPKPKRMGEGPVRFGGVDRGNIYDSYNLVRALRTDGGGGVSR